MNEIIYREIKKSDYRAIEVIINNSFGLYKYVNNPKVLKSLLKIYLQSCLAEKTFSCVAEKGGKVVGVILGQAKSDYKYLTHLNHIFAIAFHSAAMTLKSVLYQCSTSDYKKVHKIYRKLISGKEQEFDGVLTLFAVTQDCRGLGVGKKLLTNFFEYLKTKNTKHIYLYTDSSCNYNFYDNQGFVRLGEENVQITSENKASKLNIFLYDYTLK
ncbi:GNAT family N-acetyltransferase [Alkaliphilus sp. MSJ-5]|uniref:GNAT family N-acetyltransferase n=1 Tax=Alkaliphilus flagellatus TaxID=2841507 RepID=A0ABS6G1Z2_9FIRM|nr:GNAT family N-acetyltransferase [Alkaliphilus flagellatus]MBU5675420.1 GNAT family N-acetyltransferase [Alkaliphilus flagellatus]